MAGTSLLTLLDDIANVLDDVAVMSKVAAQKTGGVLGDDLALNAQQMIGIKAHREIPVVLAVAKGSLINKVILVPSAWIISYFAGFIIPWLLLIGGGYLCFEGVEKVFEKLFHSKKAETTKVESSLDFCEEEKKIKGAVRTDFVLSAEIIVITLGTVATSTFLKQAIVLSLISVLMTLIVYGFVILIVKMDDFAFYLIQKQESKFLKKVGYTLLGFAPYLIRFLGMVGTLAMFLVGGGIVSHQFQVFHSESVWIQSSVDLVLGFAIGALIFLLIRSSLFFRQRFFQ
jgi:predicted DNA repair protein MutK